MRLLLTLIAILLGFATEPARAEPRFWQNEFPLTDFETRSIESWTEIRDGGPGRDGIPALSDPAFVAVAEEALLSPREPVIALEIAGETPRAYPVRYLTWHEIVNDEVGGIPVAVTFCPLCNSAPVFDRRMEEGVLTFGVSGKLRNSDMVMYDVETESWWQQAVGKGIVGHFTDRKLVQLASWMESWAEFVARNPEGLVMAQPEFPRAYGANPYVGYDTRSAPYAFFTGEEPPHGIPALERVLRVENSAWPLSRLADVGELREAGLVISWAAGQSSALDTRQIARGRDVGTIRVRDEAGADVPHDVMFAFAFHAFFPDGDWMLGL